jgi:hypothetical protein
MSGGSIIVFAGPSVAPALRPEGPFEWLPPAKTGDLARLLHDPPSRLCLIDGLFDSCPAPWHKELLMLMSRGTLIFGAASMGALRAAELSEFGMIGIGIIYRAYAEGRLCGDDEVALIHATERLGWAPLTVPMVELRATLIRACRAGILAPSAARGLRSVAHALHFSDRDWPAIAAAAERAGHADRATMKSLEAMHVPLKRQDALACLAAALQPMPARQPCPPPPVTCFVRELLLSPAPAQQVPPQSAS